MQDKTKYTQLPKDSQKNNYQVKVMTLADLSQGRTWESLPVISYCKNCTLNDLALIVAPFVASDEVWEVRSNVLGSFRGDYYPAIGRKLLLSEMTQAFDKAFLG